MVARTRIELVVLGLWVPRFNQLSYLAISKYTTAPSFMLSLTRLPTCPHCTLHTNKLQTVSAYTVQYYCLLGLGADWLFNIDHLVVLSGDLLLYI